MQCLLYHHHKAMQVARAPAQCMIHCNLVGCRAQQQKRPSSLHHKAAAIVLTAGLTASAGLIFVPAAHAKSLQAKVEEQERLYQEQLRKMELALEQMEKARKAQPAAPPLEAAKKQESEGAAAKKGPLAFSS